MFARLSDSRINSRTHHRADRRGFAVFAVTAALLASVAPTALVPRASAAPIIVADQIASTTTKATGVSVAIGGSSPANATRTTWS